MDSNEILVESAGYGSAMRKLKLPADLKPAARDWRLTTDEFHSKVSQQLGECPGVAKNSARITGHREIVLMPNEDADWEETFEAVKEILSPYL